MSISQITNNGPQAQKIEALLKDRIPIGQIAKVVDVALNDVVFYVANRGVREESKLSVMTIKKIETLINHQVSYPDISSVLEIDQAVLSLYLQNRSFLSSSSLFSNHIPATFFSEVHFITNGNPSKL